MALAVSCLVGRDANAATIKLTDAATFFASIPHCVAPSGLYANCTTRSSLGLDTEHGADIIFKLAFDAWNLTNAADRKWTLKDGVLPGGDFVVETFRTFAEIPQGGLEIKVDWTYHGADKLDYIWTQGLLSNYTPNGPVPAFYHMDCRNDPNICPEYPTQSLGRLFRDSPAGPWPDTFFEARAFIAKTDFTNRTLTVYEGIAYDFQLSAQKVCAPAPQPGGEGAQNGPTDTSCETVSDPNTLILLGTGLVGVVVRRARRRMLN